MSNEANDFDNDDVTAITDLSELLAKRPERSSPVTREGYVAPDAATLELWIEANR